MTSHALPVVRSLQAGLAKVFLVGFIPMTKTAPDNMVLFVMVMMAGVAAHSHLGHAGMEAVRKHDGHIELG